MFVFMVKTLNFLPFLFITVQSLVEDLVLSVVELSGCCVLGDRCVFERLREFFSR